LFQKEDFKKTHTLEFINGYPIPKRHSTAITGAEEKKVLERVLERAAEAKTKFTYGAQQFHVKKHEMRYVPSHIVYDKKVGHFYRGSSGTDRLGSLL
jgi:hypothetical protein